ncbi:ATP phosphoribosyltransferase [Oxobacter pfennigii]|uniref:ATP phosphoribosyltransferase n=1 Tax=Oxobacter pfennigii TaxID=36849 RepID=A0A0P8X2C9_9CLOT|nr:ATP phosphoribosyltransferase [Oxobacter pfennigii]KPU44969.1 ATP phosphoribosyltransferase [Oxobacter pfennigii]
MRYLTIALAKGRISDECTEMLESTGLNCSEMKIESRKLIFTDEKNKVKFILVKPADVPTYVEYGSSDIGIVGKDVLLEEARDLYEPLDLGFGICRMAVAGPYNLDFKSKKAYKVATKFPNISARYFSSVGMDVKIIKLSGSVELAPLIGLSDVIVDLVQTGSTLRENGLEIKEVIADISARVVVNKASMKLENKRIIDIIERLQSVVKRS